MTPTLACLDPQRRFPVMNARTKRLLKTTHQVANRAGAGALTHYRQLKNQGFSLSGYLRGFLFLERKKVRLPSPPKIKNSQKLESLAIKSEQSHMAAYAKKTVMITKNTTS